jgi:iron complex transport system permease protein
VTAPAIAAAREPARPQPVVGVVRVATASWRLPIRAAAVSLVGLALLAALCVASICLGDFPLPVGGVLAALTGHGDPVETFVVQDLRLPRVTCGALVGCALGLSGALTQTFARNPLASPDILGVTQGASVGAVAVIVIGGSGLAGATTGDGRVGDPGIGVSAAALGGAVIAALLVYVLAWRGGIGGQRFVLVGIGCAAALSAVTSWLLVHAQVWDARAATVWLTGSLGESGWGDVRPLGIALAVLGPAALVLAPTLRVLQLGDDSARSLGVRLQLGHLATLAIAVGLAAFAVSAAGPIEFVAFAVPQVAQRLAGGSRPPLVGSAVYGAALVVGADLVARVALPTELPVGLLTAIIGAPYLIYLLVRINRRSTA